MRSSSPPSIDASSGATELTVMLVQREVVEVDVLLPVE